MLLGLGGKLFMGSMANILECGDGKKFWEWVAKFIFGGVTNCFERWNGKIFGGCHGQKIWVRW